MGGQAVPLGPFTSGIHNSSGTSDYIDNNELFDIVNLEIDSDGSLVNRPPIQQWDITGSVIVKDITVIGVFILPDKEYIAVCGLNADDKYTVELIDREDGTVWVSKEGVFSRSAIQYRNSLYVVPKFEFDGGYFSDSGVWSNIASFPTGEDAAFYLERLWVVTDDSDPLENSRVFFSAIGDPTSWDPSDWFDFDAGDGLKATAIINLMDDLIVFKEHSTFRLSAGANIAKAQIIKLSDKVGASGPRCIDTTATGMYVLHKESIYEMFNYAYKSISGSIDLSTPKDAQQRGWESKSLVVVGDRLLVRYNDYLYSYNTEVKGGWTRWDSTRSIAAPKLLKTDSNLFMYGNSDRIDNNTLYFIKDDRAEGVGTVEEFKCRIETKTYDFDRSWQYKVLFWWGTAASTSSDLVGKITIRVQFDVAWEFLFDNEYTWQRAEYERITWSGKGDRLSVTTRRPPGGGSYNRKYYKFFKKIRFRQISFELETDAVYNDVAKSAVRFYDLTAFVDAKETVVKAVS